MGAYVNQRKNAEELKTSISELLLAYFASEMGMSFEGYCSVYNSERHEELLRNIMIHILGHPYGNK